MASVMAVAFNHDRSQLATGHEDGVIRIWDPRTGELLRTFLGHTNKIWAAAFNPDGTRLATGSLDKTVRIWNPDTGEHLATLTGHSEAVYSVAYSPDGSRIVTGNAFSPSPPRMYTSHLPTTMTAPGCPLAGIRTVSGHGIPTPGRSSMRCSRQCVGLTPAALRTTMAPPCLRWAPGGGSQRFGTPATLALWGAATNGSNRSGMGNWARFSGARTLFVSPRTPRHLGRWRSTTMGPFSPSAPGTGPGFGTQPLGTGLPTSPEQLASK